jgi:uncharacterized coiled-coil protein SlyX
MDTVSEREFMIDKHKKELEKMQKRLTDVER